MPLGKRKRVSASRAVSTSMRVGNWASLARASRARLQARTTPAYMMQRVQAQIRKLNRTIETKELTRQILAHQCPHNNVVVLINPFHALASADDPMGMNTGSRIGDKITVRGLLIRAMLECSLGRSKVYFRIMVIKCAKGDTIDRNTLFKNASNNKMMDQINSERFTIVAQKIVNVSTSNQAASGVVTVPPSGIVASGTPAGIGTRLVKMWVPGNKFGRNGIVTFENNQVAQLKFFDYRIVVVTYDWYGTPQDVNFVGFINEMYTKVYFKDA